MLRAKPVPMPGNEKKVSGDFSGLWKVLVEENNGNEWKFAFHKCEEGVPYDDAKRKASQISNQQ